MGVKGKQGKIISYNTVRSILSNAAYCGYVCTKLTDYTMRKGKFDGLISRDMHERNQRLLNNMVDIAKISKSPTTIARTL